MKKRGILLPIASLPSPWGIGTLGRECREFIDFLRDTGNKCWQILPANMTSYGDSPYQSPSAFAGSPYFIDPPSLRRAGLLTDRELKACRDTPGTIDYGDLFESRLALLRTAYGRFIEKGPPAAYGQFCRRSAAWLEDFALFMAVKETRGYSQWTEWPEDLRFRRDMEAIRMEYGEKADFWRFTQFIFFRQWQAVRRYAADAGIEIIGDLPIYVSMDSADVWASPREFLLDMETLKPKDVAGVPPDGFSPDGQLWGNPLYDWERMAREDYGWWVRRMKLAMSMYDMVRIDHFRGFADYYAVPYGDENARRGVWRRGPGMDFFKSLTAQLGEMPVIAEDLGFLDAGVRKMLRDSKYPGMKVMQFAFDSEDSEYLPRHHKRNSVAYSGTHDNMTTLGWLRESDGARMSRIDRELKLHYGEGLRLDSPEDRLDPFIRMTLHTASQLAVVPMQDYMALDNSARINAPSTTSGNWKWRLPPDYRTEELAEHIRDLGQKRPKKQG